MSELSNKSQIIVDAGRDTVEPSLADKQRVRTALAAKIAVGAAVGTGLAASSHGSATTAATGTTKIIASVLLALGVVGGSFAAYQWSSSPDEKPDETATAVQPAVEREATSVNVPARIQKVDEANHDPVDDANHDPIDEANHDPVIEERPVAGSRAQHNHERKVKATQPSSASTLAAELLLIRQARTAMDQADSERALQILGEHKVRFPNAVLLEEAAAVRIDALCQMGREDAAKRQTRKFLRRWPRSPLAARVKTTCGYQENSQ